MTIKRLRDNERGSILILTMLALVGAISIAVAMSSISIVERKMTTKSRKSTTAFQSANSGIEWAMKMINNVEGISAGSDKDMMISDVFSMIPNNKGQIDCPNGNLFSANSGLECKITLLKRNSATGERVPIVGDDSMENIVAIRSAGTFGSNTERVGRALEAYAMPNCGGASKRVADFCIDDADKSSEGDWGGAIAVCENSGKRLCTAAELVAANEGGVSITNKIIAADIAGGVGSALYVLVQDSTLEISGDDDNDFRCCRNR